MNGWEVKHNRTRGPWAFCYGSLQSVELHGKLSYVGFSHTEGEAEGLGQDHKGLETIQKTGKAIITAEEN